MSRYRPHGQSRRQGRGLIDHDEMDGLPIKSWRRARTVVGAPIKLDYTTSRLFQSELAMPKDAHLLCPMSQALLQAARAGRVNTTPAVDFEEVKEGPEVKDSTKKAVGEKTGFKATKWLPVPSHLEKPEPEYLAKRRKGLPPLAQNGVVGPRTAGGVMKRVQVRRVNFEGLSYVEEILVAEGQQVEGEVLTEVTMTDAGAPGTVVEGVGIVNADGVVVASDAVQPTPTRRRAPPPRRKAKPKGRRKKVQFTAGPDGAPIPVGVNGQAVNGIVRITANGDTVMTGADQADGGDDSNLPDGDDDDEDGEDGEDGEDDDREDGEISPTPEPDAIGSPSKRSIMEMAATSVPGGVRGDDSATIQRSMDNPESSLKRPRMQLSASPEKRHSFPSSASLSNTDPLAGLHTEAPIVSKQNPPIEHLAQPFRRPSTQDSPPQLSPTQRSFSSKPLHSPPLRKTHQQSPPLQQSPPRALESKRPSFPNQAIPLPPKPAHPSLPPKPSSAFGQFSPPKPLATGPAGPNIVLDMPMFRPPTGPAHTSSTGPNATSPTRPTTDQSPVMHPRRDTPAVYPHTVIADNPAVESAATALSSRDPANFSPPPPAPEPKHAELPTHAEANNPPVPVIAPPTTTLVATAPAPASEIPTPGFNRALEASSFPASVVETARPPSIATDALSRAEGAVVLPGYDSLSAEATLEERTTGGMTDWAGDDIYKKRDSVAGGKDDSLGDLEAHLAKQPAASGTTSVSHADKREGIPDGKTGH